MPKTASTEPAEIPVEQVVDVEAYPERPYAQAISDEHFAYLAEHAPDQVPQ